MPGQINRSVSFGKYLKRLRLTRLGRGMRSYRRVADALAARGIAGTKETALWRYEMEGRIPDILTLVGLADIYNEPPTRLFEECVKDIAAGLPPARRTLATAKLKAMLRPAEGPRHAPTTPHEDDAPAALAVPPSNQYDAAAVDLLAVVQDFLTRHRAVVSETEAPRAAKAASRRHHRTRG